MTSNSDMQQLLKEIKELNRKQDVAISTIKNMNVLILTAINNMTMQLLSRECSKSSANDMTLLPSLVEANMALMTETANAKKEPTRTHGYVNWNSTHDSIKSKRWRTVMDYTYFIGRMKAGCYSNCYLGCLDCEGFAVDEDNRFSKDDEDCVYVDVSNPILRVEVDHVKEQPRPTPTEHLDRLWTTIRSCEIHTRSSFEEKYGLTWVDPSKE